jgi:transposase
MYEEAPRNGQEAVGSLAQRGCPILPLGACQCVGREPGGVAAAGRCGRPARLVGARCGRRCGARSSARGVGAARYGAKRGRSSKPITVLLRAGQRQEQSVFTTLRDQGAVKRPARGRPRLRPRRTVGDKGHSSPKARRDVRRCGMRPVIPTQSHERPRPHLDRERNRVERCVNRPKQYRRVATRYEKLAATYLAMVTIAAILIWL